MCHGLPYCMRVWPSAWVSQRQPQVRSVRKGRPRNTARRVARPAEVAKRNMPLGPSRGQCQFQVPILLRALNEHIANKRHAIAVLELKSEEFGDVRAESDADCEKVENFSHDIS